MQHTQGSWRLYGIDLLQLHKVNPQYSAFKEAFPFYLPLMDNITPTYYVLDQAQVFPNMIFDGFESFWISAIQAMIS